jgi:hypothetical protein
MSRNRFAGSPRPFGPVRRVTISRSSKLPGNWRGMLESLAETIVLVAKLAGKAIAEFLKEFPHRGVFFPPGGGIDAE